MNEITPSNYVLKRYGLTLQEWLYLYHKYDGTCHICRTTPKKFYVDHFHVKGWKNMPPEERKKYVRGLVCYVCNNRILTKGITIQRLKNAVSYLEKWENQTKGELE